MADKYPTAEDIYQEGRPGAFGQRGPFGATLKYGAQTPIPRFIRSMVDPWGSMLEDLPPLAPLEEGGPPTSMIHREPPPEMGGPPTSMIQRQAPPSTPRMSMSKDPLPFAGQLGPAPKIMESRTPSTRYGPSEEEIPTYTTGEPTGLSSNQVLANAVAAYKNLDASQADTMMAQLSPGHQRVFNERIQEPAVQVAMQERGRQKVAMEGEEAEGRRAERGLGTEGARNQMKLQQAKALILGTGPSGIPMTEEQWLMAEAGRAEAANRAQWVGEKRTAEEVKMLALGIARDTFQALVMQAYLANPAYGTKPILAGG